MDEDKSPAQEPEDIGSTAEVVQPNGQESIPLFTLIIRLLTARVRKDPEGVNAIFEQEQYFRADPKRARNRAYGWFYILVFALSVIQLARALVIEPAFIYGRFPAGSDKVGIVFMLLILVAVYAVMHLLGVILLASAVHALAKRTSPYSPQKIYPRLFTIIGLYYGAVLLLVAIIGLLGVENTYLGLDLLVWIVVWYFVRAIYDIPSDKAFVSILFPAIVFEFAVVVGISLVAGQL